MERKKTKTKPARTLRLHIRLNNEEKNKLSEMAKEHGLTLSDFVRVTVTRSQPVMPKAKPDRALFIHALNDLARVGNNCNQIAHELNRQRIVGNGHNVPERIIEGALSGVKSLSDHLLNILQGDIAG